MEKPLTSEYLDPPTINRAALVVSIKKPFADWVIFTGKEEDEDDSLTLDEIMTTGFDSKHAYLIPNFENNDDYEKYVKQQYKIIFENELMGWYTVEEMWPKNRSWKVFKEWFHWEIHTMVSDLAESAPLEHEHY